MRLYQDTEWKAVRLKDGRTILSRDSYLFGKLDWYELIYDVEVKPSEKKGYYVAV